MATDTVLQIKNRNVTRQILDQVVTLKAYIDTTVTPLAAADAYPLFNYDANTLIKSAVIVTGTVEGGSSATINLVDANGGTDLIATNDLETLGAENTSNFLDGGRFMTSAGAITLDTASEALTAAKFWVVVEMVKLTTSD